jgi:hypothetical protein
MFEVGQHVVCIYDFNRNAPNVTWLYAKGGSAPVKGTVYTVRDIGPYTGDGGIGIRLVEIINPELVHGDGETRESRFGASGFRPLKKLKVEDFMKQEVDA